MRIFYVLPNFSFTASEISFQNEKFINTSKKLLKNWNWTFPVVRYFTLTLNFVSYILARIAVLHFSPSKANVFVELIMDISSLSCSCSYFSRLFALWMFNPFFNSSLNFMLTLLKYLIISVRCPTRCVYGCRFLKIVNWGFVVFALWCSPVFLEIV